MQPRNLEDFNFSRLSVHSTKGNFGIGNVIGEPQVSIQIGLDIVKSAVSVQARGRSQHPIATIVRRILLWSSTRCCEWYIVFGEYYSRCFAGRPRANVKRHRRRFRAARTRKVIRQLFLMKVNERVRFAIRTLITPAGIDSLHQFDHGCPTVGVKSILENIISLMATGAVVFEDALQATIVWGAVRQRCEKLIAGELSLEVA